MSAMRGKAARRVAALAAGLVLDALLGDPHGWPHPVRLIGKQIEAEERLVRERILLKHPGQRVARVAGAGITATVTLLAPTAAHLALKAAEKASPWLATAAEAVLFYQLVAARSLYDESMRVHDALAKGEVEAARGAVAMIVGRDTAALDAEGLARAAVETVAENASDGVVAPMLAMGLGGAPAALFYKAANTLDSMMGYKNERYLNLGRASAKLDDALNFVPARVSGALMCAAAAPAGLDVRGAWRVFKRDRLNHSSPNSAHTEAACAGALGVQLGGPNVYFGKVVEKPTIGDATRPVEPDDILRANRLMFATAALAALMSAGLVAVSVESSPVRAMFSVLHKAVTRH